MNYEINEGTLLIEGKGKESIIYEDLNAFSIPSGSLSIMKHSCEYFGSTLTGRMDATVKLLSVYHKVPIIVEESHEILFFPTISFKNSDCIWVSFNNLKNIVPSKNGSVLIFKNGVQVELNLSYRILTNQMLRSSRLNLILKQRKSLKKE